MSADALQEAVIVSAKVLAEERKEQSMRFSFFDMNGQELKGDELPGSVSILKTTSQAKANAVLAKRTTDNFTSNLCCILSCYLPCTLCCGSNFPIKGPVITNMPDGQTVIFVVGGAADADVDVEVAMEALNKNGLQARSSFDSCP